MDITVIDAQLQCIEEYKHDHGHVPLSRQGASNPLREMKARYIAEFDANRVTPYEHIGQMYGLLSVALDRITALEALACVREEQGRQGETQ